LALAALFARLAGDETGFLDAAFLRVLETFFFTTAFLRAGAAWGGLSIPVFTAILPSALPIICAVVVRSASAPLTSGFLRVANLGSSFTGQYSR
jgi:hypothetical protein